MTHILSQTPIWFLCFFVTPLILSSVVIPLPYILHTIFSSLLKLQHRLRRENKQARLEDIRALSLHCAVAQLSSTACPKEHQVLMKDKKPNYISWEHPSEYGHLDKRGRKVSCSNPNLHRSLLYYTKGSFQLLYVFIQNSYTPQRVWG